MPNDPRLESLTYEQLKICFLSNILVSSTEDQKYNYYQNKKRSADNDMLESGLKNMGYSDSEIQWTMSKTR